MQIVEIYATSAIRFHPNGELDCFLSADYALKLVEAGKATRRAPDMDRLEFAVAKETIPRDSWEWLDALRDEGWSDAS